MPPADLDIRRDLDPPVRRPSRGRKRRSLSLMSSLTSRPSAPAACQLALMRTEADLITQFFPIFILGAPFGKLMQRGSVESVAKYMTENSGLSVRFQAIVLAGAHVTYDGVSLFEAFCARAGGTCAVQGHQFRRWSGTITAVVTLVAVHRPDGLPVTAITGAVIGAGIAFAALPVFPLGLEPVLTGARRRGSPASWG